VRRALGLAASRSALPTGQFQRDAPERAEIIESLEDDGLDDVEVQALEASLRVT